MKMKTTTQPTPGESASESGGEAPHRRHGPTGIPAVDLALRHARRVVIGVVGATIVLFGVALLFIPGPGVVFIAIGLGVLATEFVWARLWLKHLKRAAVDAAHAVTGRNKSREG